MGYKIQKKRKTRPQMVTLQVNPNVYVFHKKILALQRKTFTEWVEDEMKLYRKNPKNEKFVKAIKSTTKKEGVTNAE